MKKVKSSQVKHSCWVSASFLPHWKHNRCQPTLMETAQGRGDKKSLNLIFLHTAAARNDTRAQKKPLRTSPPEVRGQRGREKAAQQTFIQDTRRQQAEAAFLHTHTYTRRCPSAATNSVWAVTLARRSPFHLPYHKTATFTQQDSDSAHLSAPELQETSHWTSARCRLRPFGSGRSVSAVSLEAAGQLDSIGPAEETQSSLTFPAARAATNDHFCCRPIYRLSFRLVD